MKSRIARDASIVNQDINLTKLLFDLTHHCLSLIHMPNVAVRNRKIKSKRFLLRLPFLRTCQIAIIGRDFMA